MIGTEWIGSFAPVQVSDQAIYNRIERAEPWLYWLFEQVSAWLRLRLKPWEDRRLVPWASEIYAPDGINTILMIVSYKREQSETALREQHISFFQSR